MDAKSKANFINSVANGQVPCHVCNTLNDSTAINCENCGIAIKSGNASPAFATINTVNTVEDKPEDVFAHGLPEWDIVPPQVVVRRRKR